MYRHINPWMRHTCINLSIHGLEVLCRCVQMLCRSVEGFTDVVTLSRSVVALSRGGYIQFLLSNTLTETTLQSPFVQIGNLPDWKALLSSVMVQNWDSNEVPMYWYSCDRVLTYHESASEATKWHATCLFHTRHLQSMNSRHSSERVRGRLTIRL